jgi:NAD-dependent dihydropyrimidine dehydrogenase PreA subunit/DNA-binding MarR family transcriptional regulator
MQDKTVYAQLAQKLEIGARQSKVVPRILETLLDESEAKLLLAAAPAATVEELAAKTGMDAAKIETMVDPMFRKGVLFKSKKPDGTRYYRVRQVVQLHDATAVMNNPPPGMLELWKEYMRTEWGEQIKSFETAFVRVVPINVSIEPNSQILASDDVISIIERAQNIAVTKCSCRAVDGACGQPVEVCLQLDRAADYSLERGTGRKLTREEALRMLEMCEDQGLVHVAENRQGVGHVICNCCRDCCLNWPSVKSGVGKFVSPSRFRAVVDTDHCNGCEKCIERCFFDALQMGEGELAAVDEQKCMGCGVCRYACMLDAITMQVVRPQEFVPA